MKKRGLVLLAVVVTSAVLGVVLYRHLDRLGAEEQYDRAKAQLDVDPCGFKDHEGYRAAIATLGRLEGRADMQTKVRQYTLGAFLDCLGDYESGCQDLIGANHRRVREDIAQRIAARQARGPTHPGWLQKQNEAKELATDWQTNWRTGLDAKEQATFCTAWRAFTREFPSIEDNCPMCEAYYADAVQPPLTATSVPPP